MGVDIVRDPCFMLVANTVTHWHKLASDESLICAFTRLSGRSVLKKDDEIEMCEWTTGLRGIASLEGVVLVRNLADESQRTSFVPAGLSRYAAAVEQRKPTEGKCSPGDLDVLFGGAIWWLWMIALFQRIATERVADEAAKFLSDGGKLTPEQQGHADRLIGQQILYLENQWMYREMATRSDYDQAYRHFHAALDVDDMWEDVEEQCVMITSHLAELQSRELNGAVLLLALASIAAAVLFGSVSTSLDYVKEIDSSPLFMRWVPPTVTTLVLLYVGYLLWKLVRPLSLKRATNSFRLKQEGPWTRFRYEMPSDARSSLLAVVVVGCVIAFWFFATTMPRSAQKASADCARLVRLSGQLLAIATAPDVSAATNRRRACAALPPDWETIYGECTAAGHATDIDRSTLESCNVPAGPSRPTTPNGRDDAVTPAKPASTAEAAPASAPTQPPERGTPLESSDGHGAQ